MPTKSFPGRYESLALVAECVRKTAEEAGLDSMAVYEVETAVDEACTNIIENMNGTIRQVTRNVKRWRDGSMALRWTAAGMMEAKKGFRRLMAYKQLPTLKAALLAHQAAPSAPTTSDGALACTGEAA